MAEQLHETLIKSLLVGGKAHQTARTRAEEPARQLKQQLLLKQLGGMIERKNNPLLQEGAVIPGGYELGYGKTGKRELLRTKEKDVVGEQLKQEQLEKLQREEVEIDSKKRFATEDLKASATDTLDTIGKIKEGIDFFGLTGPVPAVPGVQAKKVKWQANIDKLLSQRILDVMSQMKRTSRTGATGFGQLSEKELKVLQDASTALKKTMNPKDAKELLDEMEAKLKHIISGGSEASGVSADKRGLLRTTDQQLSDEEAYSEYLRAVGGGE